MAPLLPLAATLIALATSSQQAQSGEQFSGRLLAISGRASMIRYVPGALDRADHVARRLDHIVLDLQKRIDGPSPLAAVVLGRREWEASGFELPYEIPIKVGNVSVVVALPALGDDRSVASWKRWLGTELPAIPGVPMIGTAEHASSLLISDVFFQRAVCELVVSQTLLVGQEPWITGVMAHLAMISLYDRYEPSRATQVETIFHRLRGQLPLLIKLANDKPHGDESFLLREAHLHDGARRIFAHSGQKALAKILKRARRDGGPLSRAALVHLHPVVEEWLQAMPGEVGLR